MLCTTICQKLKKFPKKQWLKKKLRKRTFLLYFFAECLNVCEIDQFFVIRGHRQFSFSIVLTCSTNSPNSLCFCSPFMIEKSASAFVFFKMFFFVLIYCQRDNSRLKNLIAYDSLLDWLIDNNAK